MESASFDPSGKMIVTGSHDKTARVWDLFTGKCRLVLTGHTYTVQSAFFSPDALRIITSSYDCTARIWDSATGECLHIIKHPAPQIETTSYSPDKKSIVIAAVGRNEAYIYDIAGDFPRLTLEDHDDWVETAFYSLDGKNIVTSSDDGTVRLWDPLTGQCRNTYKKGSEKAPNVESEPEKGRVFTNDSETFEVCSSYCNATFYNIPGLYVHGVNLNGLHPDSDLTDEDRTVLKYYGAIIEE